MVLSCKHSITPFATTNETTQCSNIAKYAILDLYSQLSVIAKYGNANFSDVNQFIKVSKISPLSTDVNYDSANKQCKYKPAHLNIR